jgi:hypothetical protein
MKTKYEHKEINKIILNIYNTYLYSYIDIILTLCNNINYIINNYNIDKYSNIEYVFDYQKELFIYISKLSYYSSTLLPLYTDIYILRRLLDKEYIKNSLIYTGDYHVIDITYFLIKYFDFKITHIYKSEIKSLDVLNDMIKKSDYTEYETFNKLEMYLFSNNYTQCSNLFNFPDNLL